MSAAAKLDINIVVQADGFALSHPIANYAIGWGTHFLAPAGKKQILRLRCAALRMTSLNQARMARRSPSAALRTGCMDGHSRASLAVAEPAEDFWESGSFAVHQDSDAVDAR